MGAKMANFLRTQNSFAHGEVSPEFYTRDDINGLSKLENMDVLPGGGLKRRPGIRHITDLQYSARLIPFSVSEDEKYILVMTTGHVIVYSDNKMMGDMLSPWSESDLADLQYAQRFGTMIFVHPDYAPQILRKTSRGFELVDFAFARNDSDMSINIPFMRFDDTTDISITVSTSDRGNSYAKFTTSSDFWTPEYVRTRFLLLSRQWIIDEYISPTEVIAYVNGTYTAPGAPVADWYEAAFSTPRGWPCSITFHQDRLVFGGSRSYPSGVWMSRVGKHTNFDTGTGLDDEAIFITLLSQQRQQICTVVSSDNLQILTSVGEWAISNKPLTPSSVDVKQHTSVGCCASRYLPPQKIEGATIFLSNNMRDIRELTLDDLGEKYTAPDLCAFAKHLMVSPIDMAYNDVTHQLFVVMDNGDMAVLNQNSGLGISAWTQYKTYGDFRSVAVLDGQTYVVTRRESKYCLECFSDDALNDAGKYDFAYRAESLPFRASGHNVSRLRIRKVSARLLDTKSVFINGARVPLPNEIYADNHTGFSGDVSVNLLGTSHNCITPYWTIHGNEPYPLTVLSVTVSGIYSV